MTYIEGIINRLNNKELQKEDNPGRMVLDGTIGEYLENYDNHVLDMFLVTATGKYLDLHGEQYKMFRRPGESDASFRNRILVEQSIVQSTSDFLKLNVVLLVYFDGLLSNNVLSSRNPYLKIEHDEDYIFLATGEDCDYLRNKFILEDILWDV